MMRGELFVFVFQFAVFSKNFPEGDADENCVENAEDKPIESAGYCATDTKPASTTLHALQDRNYNDYWREPACEIPPCTKDFLAHFVGDEGKNKGWNDNERNGEVHVKCCQAKECGA